MGEFIRVSLFPRFFFVFFFFALFNLFLDAYSVSEWAEEAIKVPEPRQVQMASTIRGTDERDGVVGKGLDRFIDSNRIGEGNGQF